jgi:hypothetical protein
MCGNHCLNFSRENPKSGVATWEEPQAEVFQEIRKLFPHENIGAIKAA